MEPQTPAKRKLEASGIFMGKSRLNKCLLTSIMKIRGFLDIDRTRSGDLPA
jgi:hypothetical protein